MPSNVVAIDTKARLPPKECRVMYIEIKGQNERQREDGGTEMCVCVCGGAETVDSPELVFRRRREEEKEEKEEKKEAQRSSLGVTKNRRQEKETKREVEKEAESYTKNKHTPARAH